MTLNRDSYESCNHTCINGGVDGDKCSISSLKTVNFERTNKWQQFCWFIPLIVDYFPAYRHGIFINPTSRDGIKSRFPTNISIKILNPTWILDASHKTGRGAPELGSGQNPNFSEFRFQLELIKKAWLEPELCYFQRDRISNIFVSNKSSQ